jgi:putative FmdB family regulatory protein
MPEYDFMCEQCNHTWSEFKQMDDRKKPLSEPCPQCSHVGSVIRLYDTGGFVDPGILNADKNIEKSGVLKELNRLKEHHPYMKWKG